MFTQKTIQLMMGLTKFIKKIAIGNGELDSPNRPFSQRTVSLMLIYCVHKIASYVHKIITYAHNIKTSFGTLGSSKSILVM